MSSDAYLSPAAQRLLKMIEALAGHEVDGLRPSDLARALDVNPPSVTRDLRNLEEAGWAQRIDGSNHWRLTPHVARISTTIHSNFARLRARLDETEQRYSRAS